MQVCKGQGVTGCVPDIWRHLADRSGICHARPAMKSPGYKTAPDNGVLQIKRVIGLILLPDCFVNVHNPASPAGTLFLAGGLHLPAICTLITDHGLLKPGARPLWPEG